MLHPWVRRMHPVVHPWVRRMHPLYTRTCYPGGYGGSCTCYPGGYGGYTSHPGMLHPATLGILPSRSTPPVLHIPLLTAAGCRTMKPWAQS